MGLHDIASGDSVDFGDSDASGESGDFGGCGDTGGSVGLGKSPVSPDPPKSPDSPVFNLLALLEAITAGLDYRSRRIYTLLLITFTIQSKPY